MEISPLKLALLLFYSFLLGMGMGVFYDANRIIRVFFGVRYSKISFEGLYSLKLPFVKRPISLKSNRGVRKFAQNAVIFAGDMLSLLIATVGIIVLNYSYNSGRFRFFTVIGTLVGFLLYYFTFGKLVMLISEPIAILTKYAFLSIFVIFGYPLMSFARFVAKNFKKCVFLCSFTLENRYKKLYNIYEKDYLLEMSKNGFLQIEDKDSEK